MSEWGGGGEGTKGACSKSIAVFTVATATLVFLTRRAIKKAWRAN